MRHLLQFTPIKYLFSFLLLSILSLHMHAQCMVDAGNDTAVCTWNGQYKIMLKPRILAGEAPFSFKWTCRDSLTPGLIFTASDFLDDTTAQNPTLIDISFEALALTLEVTDAKNNSCSDTVKVYFSQYWISLDDKYAYIQPGESAALYTSVHGGLPPLTYSWTPGNSLSDSTDVNAFASPVVSTTYYLTVTDSIGCQVQDVFYVIVTASAIHSVHGEDEIDIFPNPVPAHQPLNLVWEGIKAEKVIVTDGHGKTVLKENVYPGTNKIDLAGLVPGIYFYRLMSKHGLEGEGKFMKQ